MPRKRRGPKARGLAATIDRVAGRANHELVPYPTGWVPPSDPPTVRRNPVREVVVDIEAVSPTTGIYGFSVNSIRSRIAEHTGVPKPNFVLAHVAAWAAPGNYSIQMTDFGSAVAMYDDGDYVRRARVGIWYSKNIQKLYDNGATGTIFSVIVTDGDPVPAIRVWVSYWDSGLQ